MKNVANDRLYIWDAVFEIAGYNNDLTVLHASPLVGMIAHGSYPLPCEYQAFGVVRNKPCWLTDGICPKYPHSLHYVSNPSNEGESYYAGMQEGRRKDEERFFEVLQANFHTVTAPCKLWLKKVLRTIMLCSVILHNMVVSEKRPLCALKSNARTGHVRVSSDKQHCFER